MPATNNLTNATAPGASIKAKDTKGSPSGSAGLDSDGSRHLSFLFFGPHFSGPSFSDPVRTFSMDCGVDLLESALVPLTGSCRCVDCSP